MKPLLRAALALAAAGLCTSLALAGSNAARGSEQVQYGLTDDAWLLHGPGTLESRLSELTRLGADVVRFTVRWDQVARRRPEDPRDHEDRAYDWRVVDPVLRGLRRHGIDPVVTLVGTPSWANGGRSANWVPTSDRSFANYAFATAKRFPWIRYWTIWNEPNRASWLRPTTAPTYVESLLNPAYVQIHAVVAGAQVGGGVTAPRAGSEGVSPVAWIRGMSEAGARLDAYAHHPYPSRPNSETPWSPSCARCSTITMADLERLDNEVERAFGGKRLWLTEYGYQTNPPDALLGVAPDLQARYVASAAMRAYLAPRVDMLVFFLVRDDTADEGWQSGLVTSDGMQKPAYDAFRFPLLQTFRRGSLVGLWGQVRPRTGSQPYRLRLYQGGQAGWLGGTRWTDERGFISVTVAAPPGARIRIWSQRDDAYGGELRLN
jgi:hypothetical protein